MEKELTTAVKIKIAENGEGIRESLQLSEEAWEEMNQQRKGVLQQYKDDYIEGALSGADKPSFTKTDVMGYLQDNTSQELILLLAAENIGFILQSVLEKAQEMSEQDPMTILLKALMQGKGGDDKDTPRE